MKIVSATFASLISCLSFSAAAGTLSLLAPCSLGYCNYDFKGPITFEDVASFRAITGGEEGTSVSFDSEGGDVAAAVEIGRRLQELMVTVTVIPGGRCASACVIAFGAAPQRITFGDNVGIHRPYTATSEGTFAQRQERFDLIAREVRRLFSRSGVREDLWDAMLQVPPESVKWLSFEEVFRYGLAGRSPAFSDHEEAMEAKRLKISRQELFRRKAEAERRCKQVDALQAVQCRNRIIGYDRG